MRTTTTSVTRRARTAVIAGAVGGVAAIALGALPAGAAPTPSGPSIGTSPNLPRPCAVIVGCRDNTSFSFAHNGDTVWGASRFPQGSTGWVRYTLSCPDGYTKTALVTINGTYTAAKLSSYGEHPVAQTCTVTQNAAASFDTYAYLGQPDPDELWSSKHIQFLNYVP